MLTIGKRYATEIIMITGIIFGLASAFSQCIAYICSKKYLHKNGTPLQLLIASHLIMGGWAALCLGGLLLRQDLPPVKEYWKTLLATTGFYMFGQMAFFSAVRRTEASRIAPLLGLKIIFIALFGILFMNLRLFPHQWGAILLCFCGALLSNWSGQRIPLAGLLWLGTTIVSYSLNDISIKLLIDDIERAIGKGVSALFLAFGLTYFSVGLFSLIAAAVFRSIKPIHLKPALPFACWWFGAMLFLFACFGQIGPLLGNIVQSGRGIIAVIIGAVFARYSWTAYEEKLSRRILIGRLIAAFLITISIIVFVLPKS